MVPVIKTRLAVRPQSQPTADSEFFLPEGGGPRNNNARGGGSRYVFTSLCEFRVRFFPVDNVLQIIINNS